MLTLAEVTIVSVLALGFSLGLAMVFRSLEDRRMRGYSPRVVDFETLSLPAWIVDDSGHLFWANRAFRSLWGHTEEPPRPGRVSVVRDGQACHFEVISSGRLMLAIPADPLMRAESDLREMIQTMAKTFAQLPTGLAVFDRQRKLQSFNPALCDLTQLSPEFLSRRPSLVAMLDRMRDANMIPEPKNWKDWRKEVASMELAAARGLFEETWTLPGGQTYRVIGRPHPDGGLALMIDDISSEVIRSRRYRAELEVCQSVVDTIDDGIAVFASTGKLILANTAYASLWRYQPNETLMMTSIRQMATHWRACSAPSTQWSEIEDYITTLGDRLPWNSEVRLLDGRNMDCRLCPLADGATLVRFRETRVNPTRIAIV